MARSKITIKAEFPGATVGQALADAQGAEAELPFQVYTSEITVTRFWESVMWTEADGDLKDELRDKEWSWVATLTARSV